MKIIHISSDSKFIKQAYDSFERVAPNSNEVWLISAHCPPKDFPQNVVRVPHKQKALIELVKNTAPIDIIVIHSFSYAFIPLLEKLPLEKAVWIGWGYDYYDLTHHKLYLPKTQKFIGLNLKCSFSKLALAIPRFFYRCHKRMLFREKRKRLLIKKIAYFAPVLKSEYNVVKHQFMGDSFPKPLAWNYAAFEKDLMPDADINSPFCSGNNILIGNSASATNNHLDIFSTLAKADFSSRSIIVPLSYGDSQYASHIKKVGEKKFGSCFVPLSTFMPIQEYLNIVGSCNIVIMNHTRQQAYGNILIMLFMGACVFLREDNPLFEELTSMGITVFSINAYERGNLSLDQSLSEDTIKQHRTAILNHFGLKAADTKTRNLIKTVAHL